jgi:hypothetical protein
MSRTATAGTWTGIVAQRLARLPRLRTGIPVPFIAEWTTWRNTRTWDDTWGWVLDCACIPGQGEPLLTEICHSRQRDVMTRRACQMCGHPIGGEPFCFLSPAWNIARDQTKDPPFHRHCGRYAFSVCPGMLRFRRTGGNRYGEPVCVAECDDYTLDGYLDTGETLPAAAAPLTFAARDTVRNLIATLPAARTIYSLDDWLTGGTDAN